MSSFWKKGRLPSPVVPVFRRDTHLLALWAEFYFNYCSGCLLKLFDAITLSSKKLNLVFYLLLGFSSRPKSLKVFVNPNSHKRDAARIYNDQVAPLFKLADIRTDLTGKMCCRTQFKHFWSCCCFLFQVYHACILIISSQEHAVCITSFHEFLLWKYLSLLLLFTEDLLY